MKKLLAVVLSLVLVLGILPVSVSAETQKSYKEYIYDALYNLETEINLDKYDVHVNDVMNYFNEIVYQHPEIFYIGIEDGYYQFQPWIYEDETVSKLEVGYSINENELEDARKLIDDTVDSVISGIDTDWSDTEKALYVHDWICVNFMYDYKLYTDTGKENHDIYGFFADGRGVCESYSYTYMYILRQLGIDSYYVISETDVHAWNIIEIDDKWYHVDVTHDDPIVAQGYTYDYIGRASHNYFLLSDEQIVADGKHDDFYLPAAEENIVCKEYDGNDSWRNAETSVVEIDGYWYYLDCFEGGLVKTADFKNTERIFQIGEYVDDWNCYGWHLNKTIRKGYYTGLYEYNEHLFFTDSNKIYVYDTHHEKFNEIAVDKDDSEFFFGFYMQGKTLTYITSVPVLSEKVTKGTYKLGLHIYIGDWEIVKQPTQTENGEKVKYCYICGEIVESQIIPSLGDDKYLGDADGDGKVATTDLAVVKLSLAGAGKATSSFADMNKDGVVDTKDLAMLKLKLAGAL